jgi:hypothetical protein
VRERKEKRIGLKQLWNKARKEKEKKEGGRLEEKSEGVEEEQQPNKSRPAKTKVPPSLPKYIVSTELGASSCAS